MAGLLGNRSPRMVAVSAVLLLAAGCGAAHGPGPSPAQPASSQSRPRPSATGYVKRADFLTGVACLPTGTCVAVGWYYYGTAGPSLTLAARWNGRAWLAQPTPSRGHDSRLGGLSCASATSCIAVGAPAEAWAGTRWAVIPPAGPVSSVSCPAPGSCQAAGPPPFGTHPVAARWDGRTWQAELAPTPAPPPQDLTLTSVSCTSARFCMAVGDASHGAGARPSPSYRDRTLAEEWNGSRWQIVHTPNPSRASDLRGVSCTSPAACTAVGSSSEKWALAERWNGSRWTIQHTPNISHLGYTVLTAVSCASPVACTAVGTYNSGVFGIAEHWNGTRWTIQRLPTPPGPPGEEALVLPVSISCTSSTACMTVGTTENMTLAERWNGTRWIIEPTPNPT
jgi:hypothetical protein